LGHFGLEAFVAGSFDALRIVIEKQDLVRRQTECGGDVPEYFRIGLNEVQFVRDELWVKKPAQAEFVPDPGPVDLIVIAQAGQPKVGSQFLQQIDRSGKRAPVPRNEPIQELSRLHLELKLGHGTGRELARAATSPLKALYPLGIQPEPAGFLRRKASLGQLQKFVSSDPLDQDTSEVEEKERNIFDLRFTIFDFRSWHTFDVQVFRSGVFYLLTIIAD